MNSLSLPRSKSDKEIKDHRELIFTHIDYGVSIWSVYPRFASQRFTDALSKLKWISSRVGETFPLSNFLFFVEVFPRSIKFVYYGYTFLDNSLRMKYSIGLRLCYCRGHSALFKEEGTLKALTTSLQILNKLLLNDRFIKLNDTRKG